MADAKSALLREAAALFREYERHHRAKITEAGRPEKAERNRDIAERIEAALGSPPDLSGDRAGKIEPRTIQGLLAECDALDAGQEYDADQAFDGERTDLWEAPEVAVGTDVLRVLLAAYLTPPEPEGEPVAWKPRDGHTVHDLKCWPEFYRATKRGEKPWELRDNDRDYRQGDVLRLREWEPGQAEYTGDETSYGVGFILHGAGDWLPVGKCIMTLVPLFTRPAPGISVEEIGAILDEKIVLRALAPQELEAGFSDGYGVFGLEEAAQAIADSMGGERG